MSWNILSLLPLSLPPSLCLSLFLSLPILSLCNCLSACVSLYSNHYHVAKLLLDEGSDVNAKGFSGGTPLHVASALGFSRILDLFLKQPNCKINEQVRNNILYMYNVNVHVHVYTHACTCTCMPTWNVHAHAHAYMYVVVTRPTDSITMYMYTCSSHTLCKELHEY